MIDIENKKSVDNLIEHYKNVENISHLESLIKASEIVKQSCIDSNQQLSYVVELLRDIKK